MASTEPEHLSDVQLRDASGNLKSDDILFDCFRRRVRENGVVSADPEVTQMVATTTDETEIRSLFDRKMGALRQSAGAIFAMFVNGCMGSTSGTLSDTPVIIVRYMFISMGGVDDSTGTPLDCAADEAAIRVHCRYDPPGPQITIDSVMEMVFRMRLLGTTHQFFIIAAPVEEGAVHPALRVFTRADTGEMGMVCGVMEDGDSAFIPNKARGDEDTEGSLQVNRLVFLKMIQREFQLKGRFPEAALVEQEIEELEGTEGGGDDFQLDLDSVMSSVMEKIAVEDPTEGH